MKPPLKLGKIWESLHTSYWFIPTLMAISAVVLAFGMITVDHRLGEGLIKKLSWIYTGGPDGARAVLSTIAGSMIAVSGTVFSITVVALTLASSQFGPRLLRNFMQDTGNQIVLGTFIATFIYCLLILRTVRGDDYQIFIPQISVTVALILALLSIGVLIYFIHHAAESIQADVVIADVSNDLNDGIARLFPEKLGRKITHQIEDHFSDLPVNFEEKTCLICSRQSGYIQLIDEDKLLKIAKSHDLIIQILHRPGYFIIKGKELVRVYPDYSVNKSLKKKINQVFLVGRQRSQQQDVEFSVNQLVEIASRALSPGINDPFTAIRCIDRLCEGLCNFVEREIPSPYRYDEDKKLRVIANPVTFKSMINLAFNPIRQYVSSSVAVRIRLLEALAEIASHTHNQEDREILMTQAKMIHQDGLEDLSAEQDHQEIHEHYLTVLKTLN